MGSWSVVSASPEQTRRWGKRLGRLLLGGEIIGLVGELGSGKTCFIRGVTEGLEVGKETWVRSPTFTLINEYQGRLTVYHIDLYRVENREAIEGLDLRECLYGDGVSVIEWFDHLPRGEANGYLELQIAYAGRARRRLTFVPHGARYEKLVQRLRGQNVQRIKSSKVQR